MKIYQFIYNECIHEGSYRTVSVHRTKRGAWLALRKSIYDICMEERDRMIKYGKWSDKPMKYQRWRIDEIELLD